MPDAATEGQILNGTITIDAAAAASELMAGFGTRANASLSILSTGTLQTTSHLLFGRNGGTGSGLVSGGTLDVGGFLMVGHIAGTGSLAVSGGSVSSAETYIGYGGIGTMTVSNGTWTTGSILVGVDATQDGAGVLTVAGGVVTSSGIMLNYSLGYASSTAAVNLNGGVLVTELIRDQSGDGRGELTFNGGTFRATADQSAIFSGFAAGKVQISSGGATIDSQSYSITTDVALEGTGGLTKQGSGTLTLTGASTYTGATVIEAGTINLVGSIAESSLTTVGSGATLTGTGVVGALTIQGNGTLAPGESPGTFNAGNTTFESDGVFQFEINQAAAGEPGSNWDLLSVNGTLTIAATSADPFVIEVSSLTLANIAGQTANFNSASSYSFTFATATDGILGFSADKFFIDTVQFSNAFTGPWNVSSDGFNLSLNYNVAQIPEPSTYVLLGAGVLLVIAARRRRRR